MASRAPLGARGLVLALAVAFAVLSAGGPAYAATATEHVSALDDIFDAEAIHAPVGATVEWTNDGRNPHTVTADDGSFDSGNLAPDQTFTQTFPAAGVYRYFCTYHGAKGGIGMSGVVVVGNATLTSPSGVKVGPGREPLPSRAGQTLTVPDDYPSIQDAVNAAEPGDLILVSPGIYHGEVTVTTPYLTIRGTDRNGVVLDGDFKSANGIHVIEADGVTIQNMTARHYLLNGFYWTGVFGYLGEYLTAYNSGDYGIYAFDSVYGRFDRSYASGHPDSGFYIGQCFPCHAVITDVLAENNALGYSGTNAGGDLHIVNSVWRRNQVGIVPSSLDSEKLPPQRAAHIAGNLVYDNNNEDAPAQPYQASVIGTGIVIAGGRDNVVERNAVWNHDHYGIEVSAIPDQNFWIPEGNVVRNNVLRTSGRADLALSAPAGQGNCFATTDFDSSLPPAIETIHGCGFDLNRLGGGDLSVAAQQLALYLRAEAGHYPHGDWKTAPVPPAQPNMPDAAGTPAAPAIPVRVVPGPFTVRTPTVDLDHVEGTREVTMLGLSLGQSTWWGLLVATYLYLLPLILYVTWVSIALWDLIRREDLSTGARLGWMAAVLVVPLLGPIIYYVAGRSPIPRSSRTMLVAGGMGIYIVLAVVAIAAGS